MMKKNRENYYRFIFCIFVLLVISACGKKALTPTSQLDTPGHHVYTGLKLLELGKYSDAKREFQMASKIDPLYSKSYTGMALVQMAMGNPALAWENLDLGLKSVRSEEDRLFVNVAKIRYHTFQKSEANWLDLSKKQFEEAIALDSKHAPAYYYMGLAYKEALEFDLAAQMFAKVMDQKTEHMTDAKEQTDFLEKVKSLKPQSTAAKRIALKEQISRADTAALLVEELKIKEIYPKASEPLKEEVTLIGKKVEENISADVLDQVKEEPKDTASVQSAEMPSKAKAKDISNHFFRKEIEEILELKVVGLQNDSRGNFKPDEVISRGELAVILEDVLTKVTGEKDLAAVYVSSKSLFPDVPSDMPYFKSIIAVSSQDIMEAKNLQTKEFAPLKPVTGLEAILIMNNLKKKLKSK
ncbi:MAG TPA: S-layer homology domain-containing protein [Smithella sp.]|nr:S-layer homology domain-containing protein [Smithella sp.]